MRFSFYEFCRILRDFFLDIFKNMSCFSGRLKNKYSMYTFISSLLFELNECMKRSKSYIALDSHYYHSIFYGLFLLLFYSFYYYIAAISL
jgi:hypothetical protein